MPHGRQETVPGAMLMNPGLQLLQETPPADGDSEPTGHTLQEVAPDVELMVPASHVLQEEAPAEAPY